MYVLLRRGDLTETGFVNGVWVRYELELSGVYVLLRK